MTSVLTGANGGVALDRCGVCELLEFDVSCPIPVGDVIAVHTDPDAVVFMHAPTEDIYVAPTSHVEGISGFDASALGGFLAVLRRVAIQARGVFGGSGPAISLDTSVLPHSEGHVCFLIAPAQGDGTSKRATPSDPMMAAERLAKGLR
jgi:hypothetical protein